MKSAFAPFYSQELIIRDAWAQIHNPGVYNKLIKTTQEFVKKQNPSGFLSKIDILTNFLFINGVPGAGKTAVISNIIKKMLRYEDGKDNNTEFVSISMTTEQTDKLVKAIDEPDTGVNWSVVLNNITDKEGKVTYSDEHQILEGFQAKSNADALFKTNAKRKIVVIDEITLAQEKDLLKLKSYVEGLLQSNKDLNITILGLGDLNQSSATDNGKEVSLTNLLYNSSFRLTTSFRETNQGTLDNIQTIFTIINGAQEEFYKRRDYSLGEADEKIAKYDR